MTYANASALLVRSITRAGYDASAAMQSPDGTNGNKFSGADGRTILRVVNTNAATRTLTIEAPGTVDGQAIADLTATIPALTGDMWFGPFTGTFAQPGTNDVYFTLSAVTNVTVEVYRLPTAS